MTKAIPRLVLAGTHSGVGKTTLTLGLLAALRRRGLRVQPFKVGPDFIDPSHHAVVTGLPSHNLDSWMLDRETLGRLFRDKAQGADLALVEGVMGLFDGYDGKTERGSTAEVAKLLAAPVILAVDSSSMARSAAAIVHGFESFDPDLRVAGVIFNHVASSKHFAYLKDAVEGSCRAEVLGYLPRDASLTLPERHLGLVMAQEGVLTAELLDRLVAAIERDLSLDRLLAIAREGELRHLSGGAEEPRSGGAEERKGGGAEGRRINCPLAPQLSGPPAPRLPSSLPSLPPASITPSAPSIRIGVAWDRAFCFYYQYNLDLLRSLGAELIPFSPLEDSGLPPGVRGLYLGGGYPELHAAVLEANLPMREALRSFAGAGGPLYAECGGFMALTREIVDLKGKSHAMVGLFPTRAVMGQRLRALGYVEVEVGRDNPLGRVGERARGHEFRYSQIDPLPPEVPRAYRLHKSYQVAGQVSDPPEEGYLYQNVLASYVHLHFGSNREWARRWLALCASWG